MKNLKNILLAILIALSFTANAQLSDNPENRTTFKRKISTDKLQVLGLKDAYFLKTDEYGNFQKGYLFKLIEDLDLGAFPFYDENNNLHHQTKSTFVIRLDKNQKYYNNPVKGLFIATKSNNFGFLINEINGGVPDDEFPFYVRVHNTWYGIKGELIESESESQ